MATPVSWGGGRRFIDLACTNISDVIADLPENGHREALEGPCQRDVQVSGRGGRGAGLPGPRGGRVPCLFLDAIYVKCRRDGRVQSTAVVTVIGVGSDGVRRMLGVAAIDTETHAGWLGFLRALRGRGLSGVRLVVSDAHAGLVRAIAEYLPGAGWQRCVVHFKRNACFLLASRRRPARPCRTSSARPTPQQ